MRVCLLREEFVIPSRNRTRTRTSTSLSVKVLSSFCFCCKQTFTCPFVFAPKLFAKSEPRRKWLEMFVYSSLVFPNKVPFRCCACKPSEISVSIANQNLDSRSFLGLANTPVVLLLFLLCGSGLLSPILVLFCGWKIAV